MQQVYNAEKAKDETQIQEENVEYKLGEGEESTQSSENEISEKSAKLSQSKSNNGKEENNIEEEINNKENIDNKEDENDKEKTEEEKIEFNEMYKKMFGTEPYSVVKQAEEEKAKEEKIEEMPIIEESNTISVFEQTEEGQKIPYKFIGIAFNTYIILEIKNEMYILDQHAAHERILYERVKKNYYSDEEKNSQLLLLPDIITLTHKEMGIALDNLKMFEKAGFIVEEFGENTLKLSGVPDICVDLDTKELFLETLDEINTVSRTAKQEIEERFIATVACKAAVKANMALEREEVEALLDELLKLVNPFSCPHGRPTVIKLSKYEIERKFARK